MGAISSSGSRTPIFLGYQPAAASCQIMSSPCCETVLLNIMKHHNLSLKLHLPKAGREGWLFKLTQEKKGLDEMLAITRDKNIHSDVDRIS